MKRFVLLALAAFAVLAAGCGESESGFGSSPPQTANRPPVSDPGPDLEVSVGSLVELDGSGSFDPDRDRLTFLWILVPPDGSTATLSDTAVIRPTFIADLPGVYRVDLVVDDGEISAGPERMVVDAVGMVNAIPVADAGLARFAFVGSTVQLDGSGSRDADGDPLFYNWRFIARPLASGTTLDDATRVDPSFLVDVEGDYALELIVNDGRRSSPPARVLIQADFLLGSSATELP